MSESRASSFGAARIVNRHACACYRPLHRMHVCVEPVVYRIHRECDLVTATVHRQSAKRASSIAMCICAKRGRERLTVHRARVIVHCEADRHVRRRSLGGISDATSAAGVLVHFNVYSAQQLGCIHRCTAIGIACGD